MNTSGSANKEQTHKVFIVDDHPIMREGISEIINREKDLTFCCEAGNIPQAMQTIADCKPDIVIVDLALEKSSGIRLIENISYSYAGMLILVYSMHDESLYAERCLKAGARGYIMKQEPSRKLLLALRTVLSGNIYVSNKLSEIFLYKFTERKKEYQQSPIELLGNRELEVYQLIGMGLKKREIAGNLNISLKTVENHIEHIKKKMKFKDFHELLRSSFQNAAYDIE
ncbi:MAG: response regulator transcription factor [Nitrospirae bacterium]|nr:response regulator transcription factor [Nitrospirota bacterium]